MRQWRDTPSGIGSCRCSVRGHVLIVQRHGSTGDIRRGDAIVYRLSGSIRATAIKAARSRCRPGSAGDRCWPWRGIGWSFQPNAFTVNGVAQPLLPHMPGAGELVVPEKHWFIWPEFDIHRHGNVGEASLARRDVAAGDGFRRTVHRHDRSNVGLGGDNLHHEPICQS